MTAGSPWRPGPSGFASASDADAARRDSKVATTGAMVLRFCLGEKRVGEERDRRLDGTRTAEA